MSKQNKEPLDERQQFINQKAVGIAGIFLMICIACSMIYKVVTTDSPGWELWALIGSCFVIVISKRIMGDIEQLKSITGRPLPTDNSKKSRIIRIKDYVWQSIIFGVACGVMDVFLMLFGANDNVDVELTEYLFPGISKSMAVLVTAAIAFLTAFVISFIAEYLVGEFYKVKKYNKMLETLE